MRAGWLHPGSGRVETGWWGPAPDHTPTLVLLHEGLGCVALWRDVPALLAEQTGCGVFAYSRFGYGQSDGTALPRPLTYMQDEAADILPEVLAQAGIRQAVLIGHSDGGSIAAAYAGLAGANAPALCGVVTIAAHFFVEALNIASIRQIRETYRTGGMRDRMAKYHRDPDMAFYGWNDAWLDPGFRAFDLTEYLKRITVPVLGLQGADDPYGTEAQLQVMHRHVQAPLTTALIPSARHSPHLEAKEATLSAIARFVQKVLP